MYLGRQYASEWRDFLLLAFEAGRQAPEGSFGLASGLERGVLGPRVGQSLTEEHCERA